MADQNPIKYSDLISPDDSIEKLIGQLTQLQEIYDSMAEKIKQQAKGLTSNLKNVSGATEEGRKATKEASDETVRLERAWNQLEQATAANSKEIAKLNAAKRQMNAYNKAIVERGKEEIRTSEQIARASYNQLSAQYRLNKAYINNLTVKEREIRKNKELVRSTKEIYEQMKKLQAETGKMQLNVGNYPQLQGLISGFGRLTLGIGSAAAAGMAAVGVLKSNVSLARDYEKSVSVLAAILGTTSDQIKELTDQAEHLGATTIFTAKEVAELQTELAKLGYSTKDILNMAPSILDFAQATGSSLADAASLTGAALRMFEKDTTHTTEFVDKMSAATTKSALSFNFLNNALSTVSPVANAFGFKIEEVLALLGQLANAGFDASSAATATRNILLNLADANGKLATALGKPVTNLDELIDGLRTLNARGIDLSETLELTDKRSVAAFNTFLSGTDTVISLRDELLNANGAASQMAKTMGDNLEGSIKSLSSAWESFNLHINTSNGLFRSFIDWLTRAVRWIDKVYTKFERIIGLSKTSADEYLVERWSEMYPNLAEGGGGGAPAYTPAASGSSAGIKGGTSGKKGKKGSTKNLAKEAERQHKKELREQAQYEKESLSYRRQYEDAMIELYEDEYTKERAKTIAHYDRLKEDAFRNAHNMEEAAMLALAYEQQKQNKLADIFEEEAKAQREREDADLKARIKAMDEKEKADKEEEKKRKDRIAAFKESMVEAFNFALDQLGSYLDAWVQAAEKKAELAEREVESAKSVLDAELEARANGYASNVAQAQKELELAKKTQRKALQEQQQAQKAQQALATVQQATNLISASALIWSQLGWPLAIPAIAVMWGSFAAAKIKAAQVTSAGDEQYGEGTVELLEGGSHQSGNDIDLGRKSNGQRRRAEGGEFFAVINKRNSRRYRRQIPDVINSLNDGTFGSKYVRSRAIESQQGEMMAMAEKYRNAYDDGGINVTVQGQETDIRSLSDDVRMIREQGERETSYDANGNQIVRYKNLRRIIKR